MEPIPFLSIPLKTTDKVEWTNALLDYIQQSYAEDTTKYKPDCQLLDDLRKRALQKELEPNQALEDLSIYYNQLTFLGSKFPLDVGLNISWYPLFKPEDNPDIMSNLNYEKSCVLYRIASLYSKVGSVQNVISTEGTRKACQYFQNAAGCLKYIKTDLIHDFRSKPPPDFDLLDHFISLMMAQAHECIWRKAVMEHMKHGTIARLAVKVGDYYDQSISDSYPAYWHTYINTKSNFFKAYAHYQKANEAISSGRYGEEIARLRIARSFQLLTVQHPSLPQDFLEDLQSLHHSIERDLVRAEKDNDLVYLEPVPEPTQLAPILRSDMVKPILPTFVSDPSYWLILSDRDDPLFIKRPLFEHLVPFAVHQAASVYADKKDFMVNHVILAQLDELNLTYSNFLKKLQLPYALDVVDALPKELIECAEEVQDQGGIQSLHDMLQKVQNMSRKIVSLIEEGFNALEEENETDVLLRKTHGKLWNRPNSRSLTQNLLTMGTQHNDTIKAAQKADGIVQAKVNNWGKGIAMLSRPIDEIILHLPKLSVEDSDSGIIIDLILEIRSHLESLETEEQDRQQLAQEVQTYFEKDDISQALLQKANVLTKGSFTVKLEAEQFGPEFEEHLAAYKPFEDRLATCTVRLNDLIQSVTGLHTHFAALVANKVVLHKREKSITNLLSAFTKFKEIRTNLVEGIKFYSQYTDTITKFRDDCVDFNLARRLEASEFTKNSAPSMMLLLKK